MKREDWQRVYASRDGELEARVQQTLCALRTQTEAQERRFTMKRTMALALAAALLLAATAAVAAGLAFSERVDMKTAARQALEEQYGFTPEMEGFFACTVDEAARTVTFAPVENSGSALEEKLGVYTVTIDGRNRASAGWSLDGETVGADLQSPVWDTALLAQAMARKTAGEEWIDIRLSPQQTAVNVTPEEAVGIARAAVTEQYGAQALAQLEDWGAHLYIRDVREAEADGRGGRCYQVCFAEPGADAYDFSVRLYANDGEVFDCTRQDEEEPRVPAAQDALLQAEADSAQAKALAALTPEQAVQLAREAVASAYGLSQAQQDSLEWVQEVPMYGMSGDVPVMNVWLWLWMDGDGAPFAQGDGVYQVDVNAQTGTIENILYDSTLDSNG